MNLQKRLRAAWRESGALPTGLKALIKSLSFCEGSGAAVRIGKHMPKAGSSVVALFAIGVLLGHGASASESDISSFNTLETASPATLEKVQLLDASFKLNNVVIQRYGGLEQPTISFTVVNNSAVTIRKLYLTGVLKEKSRTVPFAAQDFSLSIPGGLQPGERKRFDLDATTYGDWSNVTKGELRKAAFTLMLKAVDDSKGDRIVRQ